MIIGLSIFIYIVVGVLFVAGFSKYNKKLDEEHAGVMLIVWPFIAIFIYSWAGLVGTI